VRCLVQTMAELPDTTLHLSHSHVHAYSLCQSVCQSVSVCLSLSLSVFHICTAAFLLCLQINYLSLTLMISASGTSFSEYNQQDATFLNLFIPVRLTTSFRQFFRPSSGASNCTHGIRHLSDHYCYLLLTWTGTSCSGQQQVAVMV